MMIYKKVNPNPRKKRVGDCVIRAISLAMNMDWESAYVSLAIYGFDMADMPSSNNVWGSFLVENGFKKMIIPDSYSPEYTVREFCKDHPTGVYVLATGSHAVCVRDGMYLDSWDSGDEVPVYYFEKER